MKKIVYLSLAVSAAFGSVIKVPNLTPTEKEHYKDYCYDYKNREENKYVFNSEYELCKSVEMLKERFNLSVAVESGSFMGGTTNFLSSIFPRVDSFEINEKYIDAAKIRFKDQPNVYIHGEDSGKMLGDLLSKLPVERIFFYLDAHWGEYWPLRDEIKQITEHCKDNCIVMIDDVRVPGNDKIGYDTYQDRICGYEYVKDVVDELFTSYKVYHLITEREHRGKLLLIPDSYTDGIELTRADFM
ncbi:MAG: hypothetical protein SP4CHLAM5_04780 [Chlamydiia bacterium]|nr:hypothetical protein [Chlamydiia bacterium]MCH9618349.1 hypothetical protein [Chlamydiia bacterium]MCH9624229.1 hypothetical protein [Chlamydiia bacterium]